MGASIGPLDAAACRGRRRWALPCAAVAAVACAGAPPDDPRVGERDAPAATFTMGCYPARDDACDAASEPLREVTLPRYFIDVTEVTQGAYAACVAAGVCALPPLTCTGTWTKAPRDDALPMTCVDADDARRFCAWRGARLPTEQEWERAARGVDGRAFPWGDQKPDCARAAIASCGLLPERVGTHAAGASPIGALDMAGNVSEWTSTPIGADQSYLVVKDYGGDWWHMRASMRLPIRADYREPGLGFRCARTPSLSGRIGAVGGS